MVLAVVFTLLLGSIAFGVGAAWNTMFQQLAQRNRFPLWAYASLATVSGVGTAVGIAFIARKWGVSDRLNGLGDAMQTDDTPPQESRAPR